MTAWTTDELGQIGATDELQIASLRRPDGTLRGPTPIWDSGPDWGPAPNG